MRLDGLGCWDNRADWLFHPHVGIEPTLIFALVCPVVDQVIVQQVRTVEAGEMMEYIAS